MAHILVVDDEAGFRALLRDILEEAGHGVTEARDGAEALAFLERGAFDLVLTDRQMPKVDGLELVRRIRARPSPPPVVVLTAHGSIPEAVDAVRLGAADYITKPLPSPGALVDLVASLLPREEEGDDFVTQDPATKELLALVDRVAARDIAVLVTGESGTGKELIARRLHAHSPRAKGPFVAVNAAALPETLAESELFGAEKGAFTGADQARAGRFEEANGGTLFLDEVGRASGRRSRPSCCACSRSGSCGGWAARARSRSTCVSSPRRTATSRRNPSPGGSGRTSSSASPSSS